MTHPFFRRLVCRVLALVALAPVCSHAAGTNLAAGKPVSASSFAASFTAANALDSDVSTYWEGKSGTFPNSLTVTLGANADVTSVVVRVPPALVWATRTQNIEVLGRLFGSASFVSLVSATNYVFNPSSNQNTVTIAVTARVAELQLKFASNSGATGGQVSDLQVLGSWTTSPDLTVDSLHTTSPAPVANQPLTLSATVQNHGTSSSAATSVRFFFDGLPLALVAVPALEVDGSIDVQTTVSNPTAGAHFLGVLVDPDHVNPESNLTDNRLFPASPILVSRAPGPNLAVQSIHPSKSNPEPGESVTFTATLKNDGDVAIPAATRTVLTLDNVHLEQTQTPAIPAGMSAEVSFPGAWSAQEGSHLVTVAGDADRSLTEQDVSDNVHILPLCVGPGAAVPWSRYEAESGVLSGGAVLRTSPSFAPGDTAAEASDQAYAALPSTAAAVSWTIRPGQGGDGLTVRFTLPDATDGLGTAGVLDCYVNGTLRATINLSSYSNWQYFLGSSGQPADKPNSGQAVFRFDEAHLLLPTALVAGDVLRLEVRDTDVELGLDFAELETVPAPLPQPENSLPVTAFGALPDDGVDDDAAFGACLVAAVQQGKSVYLPPGGYQLAARWNLGSKDSPLAALTVGGAGPWHTRVLFTSSAASGGGVSAHMSATGTLDFGNLYLSSNLRSRYSEKAYYKALNDDLGSQSLVHDLWAEHFEVGIWVGDYDHTPAIPADGLRIVNCRIRNNLADGVNFCQGTKNSSVENCSIRNNGDDGLAIWTDSTNNAPNGVNNSFLHNTIEHVWRASGIGIFGGSGHRIKGNLVKDTFMSSGLRFSTVFPGHHFEDNTGISVTKLLLVGCGTSHDVFGAERAAIDFDAASSSIRGITLQDVSVRRSQRDALAFGGFGGFSRILFVTTDIAGTGLDGVSSSFYGMTHAGAAIFSRTGTGQAAFDGLATSAIANSQTNVTAPGFVLVFPPLITASSPDVVVLTGKSFQLTASYAATGTVTTQWLKDGIELSGATQASFSVTSALRSDAGSYSLKVSNEAGERVSPPSLVTVYTATPGPMWLKAPESVTQAPGTSLTLTGSAIPGSSGGTLTYQWYRDGVALDGATGNTLTVGVLEASHGGVYTLVASDGSHGTTSRGATVLVATPEEGRLRNMSVRTIAGANDSTLIVGFYVLGGSKSYLVRAAGPSLSRWITNVMPDPTLEAHGSVNGVDAIFGSNDNWADGGAASSLGAVFSQLGAFPFQSEASLDSAVQLDVSGARTVLVRPKSGSGGGVVLVECYDAGSGNSPRLTNVSARNFASNGESSLIAGFSIDGNVPKRILVRAVGPGLAPFGLTGYLKDPRLELHSVLTGDKLVASNDEWTDEAAAATAFTAAGAFALPRASHDAALVVTVPAGNYTANVTAAEGDSGEALVEVYELP